MDLALALRMIANTSNHVINYYDRYTFPGNVFGSPGADASSQVKGLPTAVKVSVLGTTTMLLSVNYYDNQGRLVRTNSQNHLGGTDVINNEYSFVGEITKSTRTHTANGSTTIVITDYEYDHAGRLIDTWKKVGSSPRVLVSRYEYNQLGQVRSKKLHGNSVGNTFAQTINYEYNPRGWLKQSASDLFTQTLNYEDGASPQYNGNISQQVWTHADAADQSYSYTYDKLNRLIEGKMPGDIGKEALTYDKMGNILTLSRTGTSATVRDALSYTYTGHRLTKVVDGSTDATLQHHLTGTTNYTYDVNGNMESRLNTAQPGNNITDINYNHLNLPTNITATGGILTYVYDATGRKLRSTQATITTDYIDGIEWVDNTLNLLHMEEGRITKSGPNYIYEYLLKDHLGNNRSGFKAATPSTASFRSDYYPFGLQYQENIVVGSPENKYLYNGKETQKGTGMLDYGARQYDPVIGRWNVVDPLAEAYDRFSPYNYGMNDPIGKLDPNGMWVATANEYRTEDDPDEKARLMLEIRQKELDDDEKKKAEKKAQDADKGGGEKEGSAGGGNSSQENFDSFGAGLAFNAGLGIFKQGVQLSFGIFGQRPGSVGQAFVSVGVPKSPVFVDASASMHFIVGRSNSYTFDLTGSGRAYGAGYGIFSGTFSQGIDSRGDVTSNIVGFGPSVGIKYTGGGTDTQTFRMPIFLPMLSNAINGKF